MVLFKKQTFLSVLVFFSIFASGCGDKPEGEVVVENVDAPPQVTITLHSQLELDYNLDPQTSVTDADKRARDQGKSIDVAYAKLKKREGLRRALPESEADTRYQSIKRYESIDPESYAITLKKSPKLPAGDRIRKTVKVQDKPLVFAGRGYNILAFEKEAKPAIGVDYATHLVAIPPDSSDLEVLERLDLKAEYSKDTKYLIYSSTRSAFGALPPLPSEDKLEISGIVEPSIPLKVNPDSVLLFPAGQESLLVLRKAEKQFDLLAGNESLNKKQFKASSIKARETSKKISNSLQ